MIQLVAERREVGRIAHGGARRSEARGLVVRDDLGESLAGRLHGGLVQRRTQHPVDDFDSPMEEK
ncbi:MAG: hypothetical protein LVQ64_03820 [Thermoplasmatales archaeon]|nr:hypothetical protein [Thermoplasmatales archaeon]